MSEPYTLRITLPILPPMTNSSRVHWRKKHATALKIKLQVSLACHGKRPLKPLERATLTLTRCSSVEPDADGLVSGFKHVVDGLVECGVLANDRMSNIGMPDYKWRKCKPGRGSIEIEVMEVIE